MDQVGHTVNVTQLRFAPAVASHLARVVWLGRYSLDNLLVMLAAYFDGSGGADQPMMVVAGYVSTVARWERFEIDWRLALAKHGVPYFHMKEFAHFKGPFVGWEKKEGSRRHLLSDLAQIIHAYILFGVACGVRYDVFGRVNSQYGLAETFGCEYALCGRDCVAQASKKLVALGYEGKPAEFVFDDGDEGKGYLMKVLERDKKLLPIFKPALPRPEQNYPGLTPLQGADFAAYELLKNAKDIKQNSPLWEWRKSLQILVNKNNWWGEYKEKDLLQMCERAALPKREATGG
jgi:hypothetical protein